MNGEYIQIGKEAILLKERKIIKEFTDSTSSHSLSGAGGYVNSAASTTEFTIFPPVHTASAATSSSNQLSVPGDRSSVVRFEPLPDIRHSQPHSRRPAAFNNAVTHGLSSRDWFQEPHVNFPRQQLKYLRELGHGWFGRVVEGEAQGIVPEQKTSKVVVKILHEDATTTDQMYFLHEAKPYRELDHPNILKLLGRCLETDPFLVLLEACPSGDLKTFLSQNTATAEALNQQGITLQMCCNISSGLLHMHRNGFVHTDLAARNCLVTPDLSVKIGDYGTSIETFKEDYYCAGEVALPIRWCAPETLHCTETTIETKEVTASANVWSLGVVLWEVCEFGKLPYSDLSDDEVIVKVLGEGTLHLKPPSLSCPQGQNLYLLMKLCWSCMPERPPLLQVHSMLNHLYVSQEQNGKDGDSSSLKTDEDFEHRWEMFKPNSIPKTDNHIISPEKIPIVQSPTQSPGETSTRILPDDDTVAQLEEGHTLQSKALVLPPAEFESDITSRDSGNLVMDGISMTPLTTSPQPSLASSFGGEFFIPTLQQSHKSPSLQNLRGSIDDLSECTVEVTDATDWQKEDELDRVSDSMERKENAGEVLNEEGREKEVKEIVSLEPDFDSWLKGVETTNEEDAKFVRKISEAIRDLDNALALEKTSSSSSEASSKCDSHQSPARGATAEQNVVLDFRLGRADSGVSSDDKEMMFQPDSLQDDSLLDNVKSTYLEYRATDSGTDTEDEIWRRRIEQGEFSEKVKEKSKSVADLMVLTHIECSDGSDSEPPSLTWCFERSSDGRGSFSTRVRPGSLGKNVPTTFSSESNVHGAVLDEEFKATLKKQRQYIRTSKSGSDPNSSLQRFDEAKTSDVQSSNHNSSRNFLVIDASEETNKQDCVTEIIAINGETSVNEVALLCPSIAGPVLHSDVIANTAVVYDKVESKIDVNVENCVSSYSQVPEEDYMFNSMLASSCQDKKRDVVISEANDMLGADTGCAAKLGAIPHEETSKSINDNVPQKHVIESTLNNIFMLKTEALPHQNVTYQNLFSCEPHNVSSISLFATCDDFEDSFDTSTGVRTEDEYFKGEYKESNSSPLFTSAPHHPHRKVRVTDSLHPDICDFSDAIDTFPVVSDVVSTFSPSKTLNSETSFQRVDSSYIDCDHVSTSDTLSDSFHFSPVNISDVQENVSFTKQSLQVLNSPCEPQMIFNSLNTADIPLASSKNTVPAFSLKDNKQGSMVQTTVSDFIPSVVLGPCEDYTLDYFKGLKTTSGENTSLNCEDISLHLGNNTFTDEKVEKPVSGDKQKPLLVDYCIDSWDKHLSAAFLEHEVKANFFDDISFKSGTDNLTDEDKPVNHRLTSTSNNSLEPALLNHETKEINSTFENGMRNTPALLEDPESNENLDHLHVSSKHEKLVRKTNVTKTEDSVHDADIILSFLEDVGKSTTEEEIFNSCHPRCSVNFEHDLDNIVVNVTNFVEDSQVNESHDQTSTHLKHENADTNASVSKVEESIDSDSDVTCSIVEDINVCVATHISSSTEPNG
ncbi:uncharacterized protein LOC110838099, partial [Zootermopsis nevadensis]|uniref:uncharacterized protein LOC110838099 n=1 Tax=Zootermopsis nevadensis TaxID=136037 RepID=UPI000B8E2593